MKAHVAQTSWQDIPRAGALHVVEEPAKSRQLKFNDPDLRIARIFGRCFEFSSTRNRYLTLEWRE